MAVDHIALSIRFTHSRIDAYPHRGAGCGRYRSRPYATVCSNAL